MTKVGRGTVIAVVAILGFGFLLWSGMLNFNPTQAQAVAGGALGGVAITTPDANSCPDDGDTSVTYTHRNGEDSTQSDTFDASATVFMVSGNTLIKDQDITDTTAGTFTVDCGHSYAIKLRSADGLDADNAKITGIDFGTGAQLVDGYVVFPATSSTFKLQTVGSRHGILEFRAFDIDDDGFMCNSDTDCTDYELDGVTFESTTNETAKAIGSGGELHFKLSYRSNQTQNNFADFGYYILVDAGTTVWNEPTLVLDGVVLQEAKASLDSNEAAQWSGYEYVYFVDKPVTDQLNNLDFDIKALAGVDPGAGDDIQVDFAARGAYQSVNGVDINVAGVDDTSSKAVVFTVQDVTIDVS